MFSNKVWSFDITARSDQEPIQNIRKMLLLGAAGDLAGRLIFPGLAHLHQQDLLHDDFEVTGFARRDWSDDDFRDFVRGHLEEHAPEVSDNARKELLQSLTFSDADITDPDSMNDATGDSGEPVLAYLALPPSIFPDVIKALSGMPDGSKVVLEKPFGEDLTSAQELNRLLHDTFDEEDVFRADHFLGIQSLRDILAFRFANRMFQPLWSRENIREVEIIWDETLALEGRAGYYDTAGALKDMIQNHLLQVTCMVAMEEPHSMSHEDFRDAKVELLRSIREPDPDESVRARYSAGEIDGKDIPAYTDEDDVDPSGETETFASVTLHIDNERWQGVPFTLRSGKALGRNRMEAIVHFVTSDSDIFEGEDKNRLVLPIEHGDMELHLRRSDERVEELSHLALSGEPKPQEIPAYGHLVLRALQGDPTFFVRDDEAEECWKIVASIMSSWQQGKPELLEYPAGSSGPDRE